jgi:hypothetical protein
MTDLLVSNERERVNDSGNAAPGREGMSEQQGNSSNESQRGTNWNNYQTRELSANEEEQLSAEEAAEAFEDEDE